MGFFTPAFKWAFSFMDVNHSMSDQQKDTPDAREASMARVQTQETVMASLAPPASVEAAKESQDLKPDDKPNEGDQRNGKKTAQDRIVDLVHKNRDTAAKAAESEERAQRYEAELHILRAQAQPMETTNKPMRSQFINDEGYIEALTDWKADAAIAKRESQQREAQVMAEQADVAKGWEKRQQAVITSIPDYAETVGSSDVQIPAHVQQALLESEQGPEIAYYLALHPEEAKRIAAMKPLAAIRRITELERDLVDVDDTPATKKAVADPPKKSRAPEPINPVKGTLGSNPGPTSDFAEYRRRRQGK